MSVLSGDACELFNLVTSIRVIRLRAWASGHMDVWAGVFLKEGRAVQRQEHLLWLWNSKESVSLEGIEWGVSCRRWGQRVLEANVRLSLWVWWGPNEEIKQGGDRLHLWPSPVPLAALWGIELKGWGKKQADHPGATATSLGGTNMLGQLAVVELVKSGWILDAF